MPVADMFVYSILNFRGMSEDLPFVYKPGRQERLERYDWCIAQALTLRKDFTAFLETLSARNKPAQPSVPHQASRLR